MHPYSRGMLTRTLFSSSFFSNQAQDSYKKGEWLGWKHPHFLGSQPVHINLWHVHIVVYPKLECSVNDEELELSSARCVGHEEYGETLLLHLAAPTLIGVFCGGSVHACTMPQHHWKVMLSSRLQQQTLTLQSMQLPALHASQTGSGAWDIARTAALYSKSRYQHLFHYVSDF